MGRSSPRNRPSSDLILNYIHHHDLHFLERKTRVDFVGVAEGAFEGRRKGAGAVVVWVVWGGGRIWVSRVVVEMAGVFELAEELDHSEGSESLLN